MNVCTRTGALLCGQNTKHQGLDSSLVVLVRTFSVKLFVNGVLRRKYNTLSVKHMENMPKTEVLQTEELLNAGRSIDQLLGLTSITFL